MNIPETFVVRNPKMDYTTPSVREVATIIKDGLMREYAEDKDFEVPVHAMLLGYDPKNQIIVKPNGTFDEASKNEFSSFMRFVLQHRSDQQERNPVKRYVFVCEAWTISRDSKSALQDKMPSDCDDRIEVVFIDVRDRDGDFCWEAYELVRDWTTGKVIELWPHFSRHPDEQGDLKGMGGRMMNFFETQP